MSSQNIVHDPCAAPSDPDASCGNIAREREIQREKAGGRQREREAERERESERESERERAGGERELEHDGRKERESAQSNVIQANLPFLFPCLPWRVRESDCASPPALLSMLARLLSHMLTR